VWTGLDKLIVRDSVLFTIGLSVTVLCVTVRTYTPTVSSARPCEVIDDQACSLQFAAHSKLQAWFIYVRDTNHAMFAAAIS